LFMALDADRDGEISEAEINNAPTALRKLDKDGDGKLTREELRPPRDGQGRPLGRGEDRPQRGSPELYTQRLLSLDKDGDGKVSKEEAPERMRDNFDRIDTNGDGYIDSAEIEAMAARIRPGGRGPGARPNRPQPPQEPN